MLAEQSGMNTKRKQSIWAEPTTDNFRKTCLIIYTSGTPSEKPVVEAVISLSPEESIKDAMADYLKVTGRNGDERCCLPVGLLINEQTTAWEFQPAGSPSPPVDRIIPLLGYPLG